MLARRAVLLTPSRSFHPTQLLSYKQHASVSPLFAILTGRPQITENTATLSLFLATLTASAPVTPVFATLTKTAGCHFISSHSGTSPLATCLPPSDRGRSPLPLCFHTLTNSFAPLPFTTPLFSFNSKLFAENMGGGVSCAISLLSFLHCDSSFLHSVAPKRKLRPFIFNTLCALLLLWGRG